MGDFVSRDICVQQQLLFNQRMQVLENSHQQQFDDIKRRTKLLEEKNEKLKAAFAEQVKNEVLKERLRVLEQVQKDKRLEWEELNRKYPIPEFLKPYVTGVAHDIVQETEAQKLKFANVGFLGNSGTGKSSLIKQILIHLKSDAQLPQISSEGDGTKVPTPYVLDEFDSLVRLWDLPGQGTQLIPSESYLKDMGLKYFDAVLIVTDGRWTQNDGKLYSAIEFACIWCAVVRTKVDLAVEAGGNDHGYSTQQSLENVRCELQKQIPTLPELNLHLVTTRKKCWEEFGNIVELCTQVIDRIKGMPTVSDWCILDPDAIGPDDSVSAVGAKHERVQEFDISSGVADR